MIFSRCESGIKAFGFSDIVFAFKTCEAIELAEGEYNFKDKFQKNILPISREEFFVLGISPW